MTTRKKLTDFTEKPVHFNGTLLRQPILSGDSKGVYKNKHGSNVFQSVCHVEFECRKGARFADYFYWLKRNLRQKVREFGFITLYLFCGTCDLTKLVYVNERKGNHVRQKRYIDLRHTSDSSNVRYLRDQVDNIFLLLSNFPTVPVVFLEISPYSITEWNRTQGHSNPEKFKPADRILYEKKIQ